MNILEAARLSGIHHKTLEQFINQLQREYPEVDWQQGFDWEMEGPEIRDIGGSSERLAELKRRFHLSLKTVKERDIEIEKAKEEEIEYLTGSKTGVKQLLKRIYKDPSISMKQKEALKEVVIAGAPEITTLIALYNGEEQDYARRFLREMVLSPTIEIRDLLKADTLKIKSSRGWIQEINDVPLVKPVRSIDLVEKIADYELMASQPGKDFTVAVYKKKDVLKPVEAPEPVPIPLPAKPVEKPSMPVSAPPSDKKPTVEVFVSEESREVTEGNRLPGMEFCYRCGRIVKYDKYSRQINGQTVYYCSEHCYETPPPAVVSKYGTGQTVSKYTVAEIRRKPVR